MSVCRTSLRTGDWRTRLASLLCGVPRAQGGFWRDFCGDLLEEIADEAGGQAEDMEEVYRQVAGDRRLVFG